MYGRDVVERMKVDFGDRIRVNERTEEEVKVEEFDLVDRE